MGLLKKVEALRPALHHTTYITSRLTQMVRWYQTVLEIEVVFMSEQGAWTTLDQANHRVAFLVAEGLHAPMDRPHQVGHHHAAFEYPDPAAWMDTYARLRTAGIEPFQAQDHGMTMSLYYVDPDGNGVELQVDTFASWKKSTDFMRTSPHFAANPAGVAFDPRAVLAEWRAGKPFDLIHAQAYAGAYPRAAGDDSILLPEVWAPAVASPNAGGSSAAVSG